jgi:predicted nucleic acid-binding protein
VVRFLVDTNVVSELRKGPRSDPGVKSWFRSLAEESIYLSVLTIGEIRRGIESIRRRDAAAATGLETWLLRVASEHGDRILPLERAVAEEWGRMNVPDPVPVIDGLIAATAKVHGLTVATRNVDDMARCGVPLFNPFKDKSSGPPGSRRRT